MDTIRVDGNDVLAVLSATKEARRRCVESGRGVLLEAMTYRYVDSSSRHSYPYWDVDDSNVQCGPPLDL